VTLALLGFPSWQSAFRWVERQVKYGHIAKLGEVPSANGKGQNVYGKECKADLLPHEAEISEVLVHFELEEWEWRRGEDVDPRFRADADLKEYGHIFHLELDRDTERRKALGRRFKLYEGTDDFVLFVGPHERRLREVKDAGSFLGDQLLLTTIAKAAKDPFAKDAWEDIYGNKCSL
jgi:hypothetical protein